MIFQKVVHAAGVMLLVCGLLVAFSSSWHRGAEAADTADTAGAAVGGAFRILRVPLYASRDEVQERHPELEWTPHRLHNGTRVGTRGFTQAGYADGGFYQVLLARPDHEGGAENGEQVWSVTRNVRRHAAGRMPEELLAPYVAEYGPYELLCRESFPRHAVFHVYWMHAPADCSVPGLRPDQAYLYLTLVTGKWTEEFLVLADPAAGPAAMPLGRPVMQADEAKGLMNSQ